MSREGAGSRPTPPAESTPTWVRAIYVLGIIAAVILGASLLLILVAGLISDDIKASDTVTPLRVLWAALALAAAVTWIVRRGQRR